MINVVSSLLSYIALLCDIGFSRLIDKFGACLCVRVGNYVLFHVCVFTVLVPCCSVGHECRIKLCSVRLYPLAVCRRAILFKLLVFVCVLCCPMRLEYTSNVDSILLKAGTAYPILLVGSSVLFTLAFCVLFCFSSFCISYSTFFCGLPIRDCSLRFSLKFL